MVDGGDFVVDEAVGEAGFANDALGEVGLDAGGFLGPADPEAAGACFEAVALDALPKLPTRADEPDDEVAAALDAAAESDAVGEFAEGGFEVVRSAGQGDGVAGFDAELSWERACRRSRPSWT